MNGNESWRGAREKDPLFLQIFIESFSKPGGVVLDCNTSTGGAIQACRRSGRHIVALEADKQIFEGLLKPLMPDGPQDLSLKSVNCKRKERSKSSESNSSEDDDSHKNAKPKRQTCESLRLLENPPMPFQLPCYIEGIAEAFANQRSPACIEKRPNYCYSVFQFVDGEAHDVCDLSSSTSFGDSGVSGESSDSNDKSSTLCVTASN